MADDDPPSDIEDDDGTLPTGESTVDAANQTTAKRQRVKALKDWEQAREFWSRSLRDPVGGRILWNMLRDLHTFEDELFACGPNGFPNPGATDHARGQRDFGLRLYRTLVKFDREAVFALHDQFDPMFTRPKTARKPQRES
jgi:hypothetical protein